MNNLTPLERSILAGTRDDGMIPFPQGAAHAAEQIFKILENLARCGFVRYVRNKNYYRAYWITENGWRIVRALRSVNRHDLLRAA